MSTKPEHMKAKVIEDARRRDELGMSRRVRINVNVLKVLITLAHKEMRVGDYNRQVNDIVVSLEHYMSKGLFDDEGSVE